MRLNKKLICSVGVLFAGTGVSQRVVVAQNDLNVAVNANVEILTRGPVHEAFAETVVYDQEPEVVAPTPPPDPIDEVPPQDAPDAANVTWIPGYWGWDQERDDYLWVSGVWRAVPPGRQYVSGYWHRSPRGYSWTAGFWADADADEVEYLPPPPRVTEIAPPGPRPTEDVVWVPGTWLWDDGQYAWRAGRWIPAHRDWEWVPAHYVSTQEGYIFVNGYWDYTTARRGVLFAPVYVSPAARVAAVIYTPTTVIDMDVFTDHLFLSPRYHHYYFGDYYAANYAEVGIYPWFAVEARGVAYDPIYVHRHWMHRDDHDWHRHVEDNFRFRVEHVEARPPRTFSLQLSIGTRPEVAEHHLVVAGSLNKFAARPNQPFQFHLVAKAEREDLVRHVQIVKASREERKVVGEKTAQARGNEPARITTPVKMKLPASPVAAKREITPSPEKAPPPHPVPTSPNSAAPRTTTTPKPPPPPINAKPTPVPSMEKKSVPPPPARPVVPPSTEPRSIEPKPDTPKSRPVEPKPDEPLHPAPAPPPHPAPPPSEMKKPVEPPSPSPPKPMPSPGEMKKPVEPAPPPHPNPTPPSNEMKKSVPPPPPQPRPTEPPSEMKKAPPEKRPSDRDRDDDDDRSGEPAKGKSKKKDDK